MKKDEGKDEEMKRKLTRYKKRAITISTVVGRCNTCIHTYTVGLFTVIIGWMCFDIHCIAKHTQHFPMSAYTFFHFTLVVYLLLSFSLFLIHTHTHSFKYTRWFFTSFFFKEEHNFWISYFTHFFFKKKRRRDISHSGTTINPLWKSKGVWCLSISNKKMES